MKRSVVLLSGGLDSSANLALSFETELPVLALFVDYGQRAALSERRASQALAEYYGVPFRELDLRWVGKLGGSALTDASLDVPELQEDQLDSRAVTEKSAARVWVPNRNGVFINAAAAFAERYQADRVLLGFNREEAATFPDNGREFMEAITRSLSFSTSNHCEAFSHTVDWDKKQIVQALLQTKAKRFPFELLWSCYQSGETPCRQCESCQRLKRALSLGGATVSKERV